MFNEPQVIAWVAYDPRHHKLEVRWHVWEDPLADSPTKKGKRYLTRRERFWWRLLARVPKP